MQVKLLKTIGQAAVVTYRDNVTGTLMARVVSLSDLPLGLRKGQDAEISIDAIDYGTEYGIDWGVLLGQLDLVNALTDSLRNHGVWTLEDIKKQPQAVIAAINATSNMVYAEMLRQEIE